jgi:hypothetical protein
LGIADRSGTPGLLTLKAAVLRSWGNGHRTPPGSTFVGPEVEFADGWGATASALKRVDGPGWRFSAGLVRAF